MRYLAVYPHVGILILSWFLADLLIPVVRAAAWRVGVLDKPSARKVHTLPVPRLGGVAVYVAFALSLLSTLEFHPTLLLILAGGAIIVTVGMLDDVWGVPAAVKLVVLIGVVLWMAAEGLLLRLFPGVPVVNEVITILWVVFIVSSFNAVDNMNGLSGGVTLIAALFIFSVAWFEWQRWLSFVAMALAGSSLGFLRYNFPRATIFLGDSGSFFLGFVLAEVAVIGQWATNPWKGIVIPSFILGLPIFDLAFTVGLRYAAGVARTLREIIGMSDKDHCSHRLVALGYSESQAVLVLWGVTVAFGAAGLLVKWLSIPVAIGVSAAVAGGLWRFGAWLSRARVREE